MTHSGSDATEVLKDDHRKIAQLMLRLVETRGPQARKALVGTLRDNLMIHVIVEEQVFIPVLADVLDRTALRAIYCHNRELRLRLAEVMAACTDDDEFPTKVSLLGQIVREHVADQEGHAGGLFELAHREGIDLAGCARDLLTKTRRLVRDASAGRLPGPLYHAA